jgi:hypothetical protein
MLTESLRETEGGSLAAWGRQSESGGGATPSTNVLFQAAWTRVGSGWKKGIYTSHFLLLLSLGNNEVLETAEYDAL